MRLLQSGKSNSCCTCVPFGMSEKSIREIEAENAAEAQRELKRYCAEFPRSPSALRRPRLMLRGQSWIALLGSTLQEGIAGIGDTVHAALRAFDAQYSISKKRRG